jgi:hypothetical protein
MLPPSLQKRRLTLAEEREKESGLFKFKVLEIRFPVDNGDEAPDPSMGEGVMSRVWEAMDEAGVWEVITEELGWLCERVYRGGRRERGGGGGEGGVGFR